MKGQSGKDMVSKIKKQKKISIISRNNFKSYKSFGAKRCVILQPYDMEVGAGTFHPATTLDHLVQSHGKLLMFSHQEDQRMEDMEIIQIDFNIIISFKF